MPLPKPKPDEKEKDFIARCMSKLKDEFPDQDQRLAVCFSQWKKKGEKKDDGNEHEENIATETDGTEDHIEEKDEPERRYFGAEELRFDEEKNELIGYAARFNVWSDDLGFFRERIKEGAFKKTLEEGDIRALFNHDSNYILGRNKNGTLHLEEDNKGLLYIAKLPDTSYARDLKESIKRGDVTGNSFGFQTIQDKWEFKEGKEIDERTLIEARLFDVGPVVFPAYPQTTVKIRSILKANGVEFDEIALIFRQKNRGLEITDEDKTLIQHTICIMEDILKNEEPVAEDHSENVEEPRTISNLTRLHEREMKLYMQDIIGG